MDRKEIDVSLETRHKETVTERLNNANRLKTYTKSIKGMGN